MTDLADPTRTRTVSWDDPMVTAAGVAQRSGLEALRAMSAGDLPSPPIARLLQFDVSEVAADERAASFGGRASSVRTTPVVAGVASGMVLMLLPVPEGSSE